MDFDFEEEERIERYLSGACSREEKHAIQEQMVTDKTFAEKVRLTEIAYQAVDTGSYEKRILDVVADVRRAEKRRNLRQQWWLYGGTALVAAGLSFIVFLAYAPLQLPSQAQEVRAVRNINRVYEKDSSDAFALEKKKAFVLYFEAQAYLAEGNLQPAILKLEELTQIEGMRPYFQEAVLWHLTVAYMQNGNVGRAGEVYSSIGPTQEYTIKTLDRWKVWWQLQRRKLVG